MTAVVPGPARLAHRAPADELHKAIRAWSVLVVEQAP